MAVQPDNIVLVYLRRIDEKIDRVIEGVQDLKVRFEAVADRLTGVSRSLDRIGDRLDRIERRLGLIDRTL